MPKMMLMTIATGLEYRVHMSRNELIWKKKSCSMKKMKHCLDSIFIDSTALCIEFAPSPPLSARPGPSIPHKAAIVMLSRPKAIPPVVVDK